jgi:hypothetical protein
MGAGFPFFDSGLIPVQFLARVTEFGVPDFGSTFAFTLVTGAVPAPSTWSPEPRAGGRKQRADESEHRQRRVVPLRRPTPILLQLGMTCRMP